MNTAASSGPLPVPAGGPAGAVAPPPAAPAAGPVEHPPLQGTAAIVGTIALSLATFMNVLDTSIANVSLPAIAGDLGVSPNQGTWVITSFAVANAISVPLTGWLTQRVGMVRLFTSSVLLFVVASWLCGLAPSIETLIFLRVVQGAVAGPMIPLSQALLLASYPKAKAGSALAAWSLTTLIAPVMGPLLGGWITDNFSWPWIFYINVPVGLVAAAATWSIYRKRDTPKRKLPIDAVGLGLLVIWVGSLQLMLDLGKDDDWFHSSRIVGLALVAVVGLAAFLIWELTEKHPIVDLTLFSRRNFWVGTLSISLAYGVFFGSLVLIPLWLQQFMGYTATDAGMVMAPVGLFAILLSPLVGRSVGRVDPRWLTTFSFVVFAIVMWMRSRYSTQADLWHVMLPTIVQGIAVATFFVPLTALTLSGLPAHRIPAASGLSNFARITAGAIGTSVATTAWETRASLHHAQLAEHFQPGSPVVAGAMAQLGAGGLSPAQATASLNRMVDQQAFMLAANDVFLVSTVLFVVLIVVVWFARPAAGDAAAGAGAGGAH